MTYTLTTLPNGFRIATERNAEEHSAAFAIAVDVGARHETENEGGLSHLLEHMAFKGTATMNARAIAEAFDLMGGNVNAYTSHEHTVYYAKVLKEYAADALRLLCEILAGSTFDADELERERQVVLQEIAMHHDTPDDLVFDLFQEMAFAGQPLARPILGKAARVATFTREDLIHYTRKHYQPNRLVLAAAGCVDHAETLAIATEFFGSRTNAQAKTQEPAATYQGGEKTLEKDLEQVQLVLGFPGLPVTHPDYYALQVFATILGGGMSSRLFQEVRERLGLAYAVSAYASGYQDVGVLGIYAGTTAAHLPALTGALKRVLAGMREGVSDAELLRAKNQLKAGTVMTRENCGSIAEWIARHLHVYGEYRTATQLLAEIDAVTQADMVRMANLALSAATPTVAALGPIGSVNSANLSVKLAA
ncbi:MAG: pitrilysin family protein [Alphaproteobacteria bacterium]|nr:pitrilysin family protein [Alphaproteobacteria bacterium]